MKNLKSLVLTFSFTLAVVLLSVMPVFSQSGKALFERKCNRCHGGLEVTDYSIEDWA